MQAEQCFAIAHKMDRKSIWPVCVRRMAHAGLPLGGAFRLRISSPVNCSLSCSSEIWWTRPHDNGKGNDGENNGRGNDKGERQIPVVPEANAAWVLIPFLGAVLLYSSRHLFRPKAYQNTDAESGSFAKRP
jgi:hypothetical protein